MVPDPQLLHGLKGRRPTPDTSSLGALPPSLRLSRDTVTRTQTVAVQGRRPGVGSSQRDSTSVRQMYCSVTVMRTARPTPVCRKMTRDQGFLRFGRSRVRAGPGDTGELLGARRKQNRGQLHFHGLRWLACTVGVRCQTCGLKVPSQSQVCPPGPIGAVCHCLALLRGIVDKPSFWLPFCGF